MKKRKLTWRVMFCFGAFFFILMMGNGLLAQNIPQKVTGKVLNATTGEPVINATVTVKGTNTSTVTDAFGSFFHFCFKRRQTCYYFCRAFVERSNSYRRCNGCTTGTGIQKFE